MIPGSAIGRININDTPCLPKNSRRYSAAEASVPSTMAISVAMAAICNDSLIASNTSGRAKATLNHFNVKPWGGKLNAASSVLKA